MFSALFRSFLFQDIYSPWHIFILSGFFVLSSSVFVWARKFWLVSSRLSTPRQIDWIKRMRAKMEFGWGWWWRTHIRAKLWLIFDFSCRLELFARFRWLGSLKCEMTSFIDKRKNKRELSGYGMMSARFLYLRWWCLLGLLHLRSLRLLDRTNLLLLGLLGVHLLQHLVGRHRGDQQQRHENRRQANEKVGWVCDWLHVSVFDSDEVGQLQVQSTHE